MPFFTENKLCFHGSFVLFLSNLTAEDAMLAFVIRFERLPALTATCKVSKQTLTENTTEWRLRQIQPPFTLPLWAALQGFSYTSHRFISDARATSTLPLANITFVFKLPTPGVYLHILVEPFCSGYETHAARLTLNLSSQA
jgi:hypothetical protein